VKLAGAAKPSAKFATKMESEGTYDARIEASTPDDMRRKSSFSKDRAPDQASSRRKVSWTGKPEYRSKVEQQRQEQRQQDFQDVGTAPPRKGSVDVAVRRNSLELRRAATSPTTASAAPSKVSVLSSDILPWHT
jgi:hypothetical protein